MRKFSTKLLAVTSSCIEVQKRSIYILNKVFTNSGFKEINFDELSSKVSRNQKKIRHLNNDKTFKSISPNVKTGGNSSYKKADKHFFKYKVLRDEEHEYWPLIQSLRNAKNGEESKILLEGSRLVSEAVKTGVKLNTVFFSEKKQLEASNIHESSVSRLFKVSKRQLKAFSDTVHPSGIIAIVNKKNLKIRALKEISSNDEQPCLNHTLLLHHISDAGMLGTILRTAAAVNFKSVIINPAKDADIWSLKVLRAGMGAHFHLSLITLDHQNTVTHLHNSPAIYLFSTNHDHNCSVCNSFYGKEDNHIQPEPLIPYTDVSYVEGSIVVVSEGKFGGMSTLKKCTKLCFPEMNNLNIAIRASTLFYEMKRQVDKAGVSP